MSDFLLEPPVEDSPGRAAIAPGPVRQPEIRGIDWEGVAAEARGEVALVEVELGEGEHQEWGRRGECA